MYIWRPSSRGFDIVYTPSGVTVARASTQQEAEERCKQLNKEGE